MDSSVLEHLKALQLDAKKELGMIARFKESPVDEQLGMWQQVRDAIEANYSEYEVNISGYAAQLESEDNESVFAAVASD